MSLGTNYNIKFRNRYFTKGLISLSVILVTLTPAIEAYTYQLSRELRRFSLNRDKLKIDYLVENLRKKSDLGFDREDLFWTLQIEISGIHLYIQETTTTINIPSRLLQLLLQLRMCGGGNQCCLAGCINDAGSYPLTACRGSYEANPNMCVLNITVGIETITWIMRRVK